MKELLILARETALHALRIVTLRSAGESLPDSKWFAYWSAAWSLPLVIAEQLVRHGLGLLGVIIVPLAWAGAVWTLSRNDGKTSYRIASSLLLASVPICIANIIVAGNELMEWGVSAWGAAVVFNVILRQHKKERLWL